MGDEFDLGGRLRIDISELEELPDRTEAAVAAADGHTIGITTEVEDRQATASFRDTDRAIARLDKAVARPKIEVDGSQADATIADLRAQFASLDVSMEKLRVSSAGTSLGAPGAPGGGGGGTAAAAGGAAGFAKYGAMAAAIAIPVAIEGTRQLINATVPKAQQSAKVEKAVTRTFGAETGQEFIAASEALADATGFLAQDFREAALAGKTLAAMSDHPAKAARLQTEAIKQLLPVAADLAASSPDKQLQSVAGAFNAMKLAIAGSASAQERLGVDLSDAHMQSRAFGGSLRDTWAALSDAEKAQLRYQEMLAQTKDVMGEAGDDTSLETQTRKLNEQLSDLAVAVGDQLLEPLAGFVKMIRELVDAIPDWVPKVIGAAAEYGPTAVKVGALVNPVTQIPATGGWAANKVWGGKTLPQSSTNLGALTGAGVRPDYYPAAPGPTSAVPATVKVSLNVRREPGTTINLDGASWAPSNA